MTISKTKNDNYLSYLILEIIMLTVITFLGVAFVVFYITGKTDTKTKSTYLTYLLENPLIYGLVCFLPALLAIIILLFFRNRNYIIGYEFDDSSKTLHLNYRGLVNKASIDISIPYNEVQTKDFNEKKFLFNQTYKGKSIIIKEKNIKIDFITNNFIWESQPREKVFFLQELQRIINS